MAKNKKLRKAVERSAPAVAAPPVPPPPVKVKGPAQLPKKPKVPKKRYVRPPRVAVPEKPVAKGPPPKAPGLTGKILAGAAASMVLPPDDETPGTLPKWAMIR